MHALLKEIEAVPTLTRFGRVARIEGLGVEVTGAAGAVSLGGQVRISSRKWQENFLRSGRLSRRPRPGHAAGSAGRHYLGRPRRFRRQSGLHLSLQGLAGPGLERLRRAAGRQGPLAAGHDAPIRIKAAPPPATTRGRVGAKLDLGVRAMNAFTTCCQGQRMGIFRGLRRGQIHLAGHAGAQFQCRRHRDRTDRRTRPRSEGIHRGRSGRRRSGAQRRRGRHIRRSAAGAPPGRLCGHDGGRAVARPGPECAAC